jgi:hypothetical protein
MITRQAHPDTASTFMKFNLDNHDTDLALQVSPLFLAYLQNKIEAYASALVEKQLPYSPNPMEQVTAILAHERLRNFVEAYQELMSEILQAAQDEQSTTNQQR